MSIGKAILKAPIHVYRWTLKPLMGMECRHLPNGPWRGFWLMLSRLSRCHPWGTAGYDAVPDIRAERHVLAPWRYGRWSWSGGTPGSQSDG